MSRIIDPFRFVSAGGGVGFALVSSSSASSPDAASATTAGIDTTGSNLLVAAIACNNPQAPTLSDSLGNTWVALSSSAATVKTQLFYSAAPIVGASHTFTISGSSSFPSICVAAFSGAASSPYLSEAGDTDGTPGPITPSVNNALLVTGLGWFSPATLSIDSGFTIAAQIAFQQGLAYGSALAFKVQTAAAAESPAWTAAGAGGMTSRIASFAP